jgi:hypothetical protein
MSFNILWIQYEKGTKGMKSMIKMNSISNNLLPACTQVTIFMVLVACLVTPAFAGTKHEDGYPDITAYIAGTNEYSPCDDIQIPVMIVNNGISGSKKWDK